MPPKSNTPTLKWVQEKDIYLLYDNDDSSLVMPFAEYLRQFYTVFDPHTDGVPGEPEQRSWLEIGIYKSKLTAVFLSKKSTKNPECEFQLANAVKRLTETKYRHRIVVIMVEGCKVTKNLRHFNVIYAFQKDSKEDIFSRIREAIEAPKEKFTCLDLTWSVPPTVKQTVVGIPKLKHQKTQKEPIKTTLLYIIWNARKVVDVLKNFALRCNKEGCTFRCDNLQVAHEHSKMCKFEWVECGFCKQNVSRRNIQKHEQRKCRFRRVKCTNDGCAHLASSCDLESHKRTCAYQLEQCRNSRYGCKSFHLKKDAKTHKEVCNYEKCVCNLCKNELLKIDLNKHHCRNRDERNDMFSCDNIGCMFEGSVNDVLRHHLCCEFRKQKCRHCSRLIPAGILTEHDQECLYLTSCNQCGLTIPRSLLESHRRLSCSDSAMVTLCDSCHSFTDDVTMETHKSTDCVNYMRQTSMQNTAEDLNQNAEKSVENYDAVSRPVPTVRGKQKGLALPFLRLRGCERYTDAARENSNVSSDYVNFKDHQKHGVMTRERRDWFNKIGTPDSPGLSDSGICQSSAWYTYSYT